MMMTMMMMMMMMMGGSSGGDGDRADFAIDIGDDNDGDFFMEI